MSNTITPSWKHVSSLEERCKFIDKEKNDGDQSVTTPMMELAIFVFMMRHMNFVVRYGGSAADIVFTMCRYWRYYFLNVTLHSTDEGFCGWYNENYKHRPPLSPALSGNINTTFNLTRFIETINNACNLVMSYIAIRDNYSRNEQRVRAKRLVDEKMVELRMYMYEVFPSEPFAQPSENIRNHPDFPVMIKQYLDRTLPEEIFADWMTDANDGDDRDVTIQHLRRRGPQTKQYVHLYGSHVFPVWAMRYF